HIRQHKGMDGMIEHLFHLVDGVFRSYMEYLRHQILQQMSDFFLYPVVLRVLIRHDFELVVIQIPGCRKGRNTENCGRVAAADSPPPIFQPYIFRQIRRVHKYARLIGCCSFWHIMHLVSVSACTFWAVHTRCAEDTLLSSWPPF